MFGDMEGNDYLCRSWFKLLIRGSFPSIIAEAVFAKGRLFLRLSVKICRSNVKNAIFLYFFEKKLRKNLEI